ncbi:membrane protein [Bacteroidota bacterium]|nr:membrane protein [Bacteroidota bacterium]
MNSISELLHNPIYQYGFFMFIILTSLTLDILYLRRNKVGMRFKQALFQSVCWISLAVAYGYIIYLEKGRAATAEYFSAYIMEYSLSMDNIFVFILILNFFKVSDKYYALVLFWGILIAIILRLIFISAGSAIVSQFHWVLYFFGAFLIYTGYKILFTKEDDEFDPAKSPVYKLLNKYMPISDTEAGGRFFIREKGKRLATRLFVVIVIIATTDIVFALDSIPAAFAITRDSMLIITSNIFAVIGLRAMFFMLSNAVTMFRFLQQGISLVLMFIGIKMLIQYFDIHIHTEISLLVIIATLCLSIALSVLIKPSDNHNKHKASH